MQILATNFKSISLIKTKELDLYCFKFWKIWPKSEVSIFSLLNARNLERVWKKLWRLFLLSMHRHLDSSTETGFPLISLVQIQKMTVTTSFSASLLLNNFLC